MNIVTLIRESIEFFYNKDTAVEIISKTPAVYGVLVSIGDESFQAYSDRTYNIVKKGPFLESNSRNVIAMALNNL